MTADADHEQETTAGPCNDDTTVVPADASSLTADAAEYVHAWSVETDEFQPLRQRASASVWAVLGLLVVVVAVAVVWLATTLFNSSSSNHVESKPVPSAVAPPQSAPSTVTVLAPPPPPTVTVTAQPPPPATVTAQPPAPVTNFDFIMCPSGHDGVATSVTSCEFADNVRRSYLAQHGPVVMAYSPVTGNVYTMQCVSGFTAHMSNGLVVDAVRCAGGNDAVVVLW